MDNENVSLSAAYSFLAALTENQKDLYNHVYVPICKRALSFYNNRYGGKAGKWSDIREIILSEYGINVPQVIVKKLINSTYKVLSNSEKKKIGFEIYDSGDAFKIAKYEFMDLEEKYKRGQREANALQDAFTVYLETNNLFIDGIPSIYEFLEKNKKQIAVFFSNTYSDILVEKSFFHHLEFFRHIEIRNQNLYKIAENQFIGSLLAGFFEAGISFDPKFSTNEIYYIDTSVALRALDLRKEEETEAVRELLALILSTGGQIKILSITVDEIKKILENAITYYDNSNPTTTINEACLRLKKNKTWLMNFSSNLANIIQDELNIKIESLLPSFIEKYKHCNEVKELQATRSRRNALHDVLAYMHIRQKRGNSIYSFQKAKFWFLSTNDGLLKFNKKHMLGSVPEIVITDSLTSLLWLKNPVKFVNSVKKTGLNILLATTFNEEFANRELINDFNNVINNIEGVTEEDYNLLLESVAYQSAKKIELFIETAITDGEKAKAEAHKIIEKERGRRHKVNEEKKNAFATIKRKEEEAFELNNRLTEIEERLLDIVKKSTDATEAAKKKELYTKKIIKSLIVIIFVLVVVLLNLFFKFIPKIINWIISAGGLFTFFNLLLNIINSLRKK